MNLICKIIEQKGDKVIVEIENQQITLSLKYFSENIIANKEYQVLLWTSDDPINNKNLAKIILEEILNGK